MRDGVPPRPQVNMDPEPIIIIIDPKGF